MMDNTANYGERDVAIITFLVLCSVLATFFIDAIFSSIFQISHNGTSIYPQSVVQLNDLAVQENRYLTTSNDPWILCEIPETKISGIELQFSRKAEMNIPITIYYSLDEEFSQDRSVSCILKSKSLSVQIRMPKGNYSRLRIDIGNTEGISYMLRDIRIKQFFLPVQNPELFLAVLIILLLILPKQYIVVMGHIRRRSGLRRVVLLTNKIFFALIIGYLLLGQNYYNCFLFLLGLLFFDFEIKFLCHYDTSTEKVELL